MEVLDGPWIYNQKHSWGDIPLTLKDGEWKLLDDPDTKDLVLAYIAERTNVNANQIGYLRYKKCGEGPIVSVKGVRSENAILFNINIAPLENKPLLEQNKKYIIRLAIEKNERFFK